LNFECTTTLYFVLRSILALIFDIERWIRDIY